MQRFKNVSHSFIEVQFTGMSLSVCVFVKCRPSYRLTTSRCLKTVSHIWWYKGTPKPQCVETRAFVLCSKNKKWPLQEYTRLFKGTVLMSIQRLDSGCSEDISLYISIMSVQLWLYQVGRLQIIGQSNAVCSAASSSRLTNKSATVHITGHLSGEVTGDRWILLAERQWCGNCFHYDVIVVVLVNCSSQVCFLGNLSEVLHVKTWPHHARNARDQPD